MRAPSERSVVIARFDLSTRAAWADDPVAFETGWLRVVLVERHGYAPGSIGHSFYARRARIAITNLRLLRKSAH